MKRVWFLRSLNSESSESLLSQAVLLVAGEKNSRKERRRSEGERKGEEGESERPCCFLQVFSPLLARSGDLDVEECAPLFRVGREIVSPTFQSHLHTPLSSLETKSTSTNRACLCVLVLGEEELWDGLSSMFLALDKNATRGILWTRFYQVLPVQVQNQNRFE